MVRRPNTLSTALAALALFAVGAAPAEAAKIASFTLEDPAPATKPVTKKQARSADGCENATARAGEVSEEALASSAVCLLNDERTDRGLRPLHVNGRLSAAAGQHTRDMVRRRYFSHTSRSGSDMGDRIRSQGYLSGARSWMLGENLAWGSGGRSTPRSIVNAWMDSPGHRRNILTARFREIGIGVVDDTPVDTANRGATYTTTVRRPQLTFRRLDGAGGHGRPPGLPSPPGRAVEDRQRPGRRPRPGLSPCSYPQCVPDGLTDSQRAAVTHAGGPLLVAGAAGSGRTTVLEHRLAWLVQQGAAADRVLALAATPQAAQATRSRLYELVRRPTTS